MRRNLIAAVVALMLAGCAAVPAFSAERSVCEKVDNDITGILSSALKGGNSMPVVKTFTGAEFTIVAQIVTAHMSGASPEQVASMLAADRVDLVILHGAQENFLFFSSGGCTLAVASLDENAVLSLLSLLLNQRT